MNTVTGSSVSLVWQESSFVPWSCLRRGVQEVMRVLKGRLLWVYLLGLERFLRTRPCSWCPPVSTSAARGSSRCSSCSKTCRRRRTNVSVTDKSNCRTNQLQVERPTKTQEWWSWSQRTPHQKTSSPDLKTTRQAAHWSVSNAFKCFIFLSDVAEIKVSHSSSRKTTEQYKDANMPTDSIKLTSGQKVKQACSHRTPGSMQDGVSGTRRPLDIQDPQQLKALKKTQK